MDKIKEHLTTKNSRGFMHPISNIGKEFLVFSKRNYPVIEMGCAYGNLVIEALKNGVRKIIACDMESQHLDALKEIEGTFPDRLQIRQGTFPEDFDFRENSIAAIHASHIFEYLNGDDLTIGLSKFYNWLKPGGKLFLLCYTIFTKGMDNPIFKEEYEKRVKNNSDWPGYFKEFKKFLLKNCESTINFDNNALPESLHFYEKNTLTRVLKNTGFEIEYSKYIDGEKNGAIKETLLDGREYLGIIATKGV